MRVAISADNGNGLDSVVSPHFGRCPYFVLVDLEGQEVKAVQSIANPYYGNHQPGQVPGFIHSQGANVMLTGGMGRRAIGFFQQYGIEAATGASGSVRHTLERYLGGMLQGAAPCRESVARAHEDASRNVGAYEKNEAGRLCEEVQALQQQLDEAVARLERLDARGGRG